jgi:hypothetical protein
MGTHITMNANASNRRQFREVIQLFIEGKMNCYTAIVVKADGGEDAVCIEKSKYRASLFMIHGMLKTMEREEIADALGISCHLLNTWESEKLFRTLMYSNYKEFLIFLGELYT